MKRTGAQLLAFALEQVGVKYTFGIPGTHTTEIYDAINESKAIEPILVTHEGGAAFMADAISRTTDSIGCITIVPAAGLTHAMSGIGEAFLDGIPMLVISGGTRTDSGRHYQLHQIDLIPLAKPITKAQFLIEKQQDIIFTIYEAYEIANAGEPGPVFVEIPVNILMFSAEVQEMQTYQATTPSFQIEQDQLTQAVDLLSKAKNPMLYLGWGAREATEYSLKIAEHLAAPVSVTLQGKSVFPNDHPLFTSCLIGKSAKPSSQDALKKHNCLLAVGCRFSEIATGSYGLDDPKNLIHIDINASVFNKNYPAKLCIQGDAKVILKAIWEELEKSVSRRDSQAIEQRISQLNHKYLQEWLSPKKEKIVSPGWFFKALNEKLEADAYVALDDGKHTFLAAELLNTKKAKHFISPTDFNCMGYCIPATIATKLAHPDQQVIGIVGDGAALMTGLEMITAASYGIAPVFFIFNDGELGQISQFQTVPLNRKTCSVLGKVNFEGLAITAGIPYLSLDNDFEIEQKIDEALQLSKAGQAVLVDVNIDYSKKTMLTKGVIKVNLSRFPLKEKIRFLGRAVKRHLS